MYDDDESLLFHFAFLWLWIEIKLNHFCRIKSHCHVQILNWKCMTSISVDDAELKLFFLWWFFNLFNIQTIGISIVLKKPGGLIQQIKSGF